MFQQVQRYNKVEGIILERRALDQPDAACPLIAARRQGESSFGSIQADHRSGFAQLASRESRPASGIQNERIPKTKRPHQAAQQMTTSLEPPMGTLEGPHFRKLIWSHCKHASKDCDGAGEFQKDRGASAARPAAG